MKCLLAIGACLLAALPAAAQNAGRGQVGSSLQSLSQFAPTTSLQPLGNVHPAVARIVAPGNGSISYGSGTLVYTDSQYGLVITNWHVINEATGPISVHFPDGFYSLGAVQRVDRDWDLAAIAIRRPNASPVRLATVPARPGELLTIAGYGSGTYRAASGPCTQYVAPGSTFPFEMVEVAVKARQGDSGGPIFNGRGELAGVLFGEGEGRTSGSYCGRVRWFLANIVPDPTLGAGMIAAAGLKPIPPRPPAVETAPAANATIEVAQTPAIPISRPRSIVSAEPAEETSTATTIPIAEVAAGNKPPVVMASTQAGEPEVAMVQTIGWEDFAGHSTGEQAKTVLAIIGVLAIVVHALSWLSRERPAAK